MSLPGLQLSAPVETTVTPIIHDLKEGTEWRFEVAFGTKVEVRVRAFSVPKPFNLHPLLMNLSSASLWER